MIINFFDEDEGHIGDCEGEIPPIGNLVVMSDYRQGQSFKKQSFIVTKYGAYSFSLSDNSSSETVTGYSLASLEVYLKEGFKR